MIISEVYANVDTFPFQQIAREGNMIYQKVIARWKDITEWMNLKI